MKMDLTMNQIDEIFKIQNNEEWCHLKKNFEISKICGVIDFDKLYSDEMTLKEYFELMGKNKVKNGI